MVNAKKIAYLRSSNIYNDSRATKEILCLRDAGYDVTVFLWDRDGKEDAHFLSIFGNKVKSVSYKVVLNRNLGKKGILKLIKFMKWMYRSLLKYSFDGVHACDLDTGYIASKYCQKKICKLIYDVYDYYADSHGADGLMRIFFEKAENKVINNSDLTIICTEERRIQIKNANPNDVVVIYNSPEIESISNSHDIEYDYVYCGSLYNERLLSEIFSDYSKNQDLRMCIAGRGVLEKQALKCKGKNFVYLGSIPYNRVLEEESKGIAISAIYDPSKNRNNRLCAPNKFYEAMALSKPVIVCKGSGIDELVEREHIGVVINYSSNDFYKALRHLKEHPMECNLMGKNGRNIYDNKYSWRLMKRRLLDAYIRVFE